METVDPKKKNFLNESEIEEFLKAARKGKHPERDYCLALMTYRHGLRVSEVIDIRLNEVDLDVSRLYVRRLKQSLSTHQPIEGDELRALRAYLRIRIAYHSAGGKFLFLGERGPLTRQAVNYLFEQIGKRAGFEFKVTPHMLRHSCGFALAEKGYDVRLIQDWLGHTNIKNTVIYTRTASRRFEGLWR